MLSETISKENNSNNRTSDANLDSDIVIRYNYTDFENYYLQKKK